MADSRLLDTIKENTSVAWQELWNALASSPICIIGCDLISPPRNYFSGTITDKTLLFRTCFYPRSKLLSRWELSQLDHSNNFYITISISLTLAEFNCCSYYLSRMSFLIPGFFLDYLRNLPRQRKSLPQMGARRYHLQGLCFLLYCSCALVLKLKNCKGQHSSNWCNASKETLLLCCPRSNQLINQQQVKLLHSKIKIKFQIDVFLLKLADTIRGLTIYNISYQMWVTKSVSLNTVILILFCGRLPL